MALVFQYGSNTSSARLNSPDRLNGDAKSLGLAYTMGQYDLGFTVFSSTNNCAAADLVRTPGRKAWGVLYEIPDNLLSKNTAGNRKSLEAIEGPQYRKRKIRVCKVNAPDTQLTVWTYTVKTKQKGWKTSREYVNHILSGLYAHHAPADYIEHVKDRILNNNPDLREYI